MCNLCKKKNYWWSLIICNIDLIYDKLNNLPELWSNTSWRSSPSPRIAEWWAPQLIYMLLEKFASTKPWWNAIAVKSRTDNKVCKLAISTQIETYLLLSIRGFKVECFPKVILWLLYSLSPAKAPCWDEACFYYLLINIIYF